VAKVGVKLGAEIEKAEVVEDRASFTTTHSLCSFPGGEVIQGRLITYSYMELHDRFLSDQVVRLNRFAGSLCGTIASIGGVTVVVLQDKEESHGMDCIPILDEI
jgi:hypothetical protein